MEISGEDFNVEAMDDGPKPFRAFLDVGLTRTTTGNRVFAAMKGAVDGGIDIPHGTKRFVGYDTEADTLDGDRLRHYIFGGHVSDYMRHMQEEDEEKYKSHFARYIKEGINADNLEQMYQDAHTKIRANPSHDAKPKREDIKPKRWNRIKMSRQQKDDRVKQQKAAYLRKLQQED